MKPGKPGYLKVKSCQEMAKFLKITKYKIQITNKFQITMSEITNSPIGLDKRHHFVLPAAGVYLPEGRQPIIPLFQHSIIPIVSEAN